MKKMPPPIISKIVAVPRSGCINTSAAGTTAIAVGRTKTKGLRMSSTLSRWK